MDEIKSVVLTKALALDIDAALAQAIVDFTYLPPDATNGAQARHFKEAREAFMKAWANGTGG